MLKYLTQPLRVGGLLLAVGTARAQEVPRIYPAPAPTPLDSATHAPDLKDKQ